MAGEDAAGRRPIEHRPPRVATIKQLYGTAFRCGEPSCAKPLYRVNDDTGEWILNSRVAHIHARSENGPRWDPEMSEEDNRSADNLLLLCEEHASEIDITPQHYPADLLHEWKSAQLAEHASLGRSWPLSDAEAAEVAAVSFDHRTVAQANAGANAVVSVARLVALLIETGRVRRRSPQEAARAWLEMRQRVNRSTPVFDANGERVWVEPSRVETEPLRTALESALTEAVEGLEPIAAQAIAELHAVNAANQDLAPWCDWVETAIRDAIDAAGRWPGRPPAEDDVWPPAVEGLRRASQALTARWRGEDAPQPPAPPPPTSEPAESDQQRAYREHRELLDTARPWARVTHRPYDADLCSRLMGATSTTVRWPEIPSLLDMGLDVTAGLAADVARNADAGAFAELITRAAEAQPLAAAVALLQQFMFVAQKAGRADLQAEAADRASELLRAQAWQDPAVWIDNQFYVRRLLGWTASITSDESVQAILTAAIERNPDLLLVVLPTMAQWSEHRDTHAFDEILGLSFQISDLPPWFPADAFTSAISRIFPHVQPADEDESGQYADDVERLASQVLRLGSTPPPLAAG